METSEVSGSWENVQEVVRLYHGTDLASAYSILHHGFDPKAAAALNASGEFWATTDVGTADVFAYANPNSPPGARVEFDVRTEVIERLLRASPPKAHEYSRQSVTNYEFLPASSSILKQSMQNVDVVQLP